MDSRARLWLSPVTPSAASEPNYAELIDSSSIPAALAALCVRSEAGPLPSTSVTRRPQYYGPIRHLPGPPLALTGLALPFDGHPDRLPLLHIESVPCVLPPIPRQNRRMLLSSLLLRRRPSPLLRRVGFCSLVFRACSVFTARCGPHGLLTPRRSLFLECFRPFVTSRSAPSASGWDKHRRSGFSPEDSMCLSKAHTTRTMSRPIN